MPNADGRIPPVSIPRVPWCLTCKLVACVCPSDQAQPTSRIPGYVGHIERRTVHRFATPVVHERRSSRRQS